MTPTVKHHDRLAGQVDLILTDPKSWVQTVLNSPRGTFARPEAAATTTTEPGSEPLDDKICEEMADYNSCLGYNGMWRVSEAMRDEIVIRFLFLVERKIRTERHRLAAQQGETP